MLDEFNSLGGASMCGIGKFKAFLLKNDGGYFVCDKICGKENADSGIMRRSVKRSLADMVEICNFYLKSNFAVFLHTKRGGILSNFIGKNIKIWVGA